MVDILKELIGKDIYLRPTGNNARRNPETIHTGRILKVGKVFVTFLLNESTREIKYRYKGDHLYDGCNGGYEVHETREGILDYFKKNKLATKIAEEYRYASSFKKFDLEKLAQIADLLEVEY